MNAAVLKSLVDEIFPRVVGRRIADVRASAQGCVELVLAGDPPLRLCAVSLRALPLLCLAAEEGCGRNALPGDQPGRLGEIVGATILTLEVAAGTPVAHLTGRRTNSAGRTFERVLTIDLGSRPAVSLGNPAHAHAVDDADDAPPAPAIAWRHDDSGRLHVGFPPSNRTWEGEESFETWNDAALHAVREFLPELIAERRRSRLRSAVVRALKRKRRALEKVRREVEDSGRADEYRRLAQLLLTRKNDVKRGATPVTVLDYDNVTPVEIEVDPLRTPARNAEILFARARKAERRALHAPRRVTEIEEEMVELESDLERIDDAPPELLSELEEKMRPPRPREVRGRKGERASFRTYEVSGGWKVLVGKSNRDNDVLTHRIARPDDLWFHARQAPGSHVILRRAGAATEPGGHSGDRGDSGLPQQGRPVVGRPRLLRRAAAREKTARRQAGPRGREEREGHLRGSGAPVETQASRRAP